MGPNSGGGRRNKNNNQQQGSARSRFSKWRPPTKNIKDKFRKQQEHRTTGDAISGVGGKEPKDGSSIVSNRSSISVVKLASNGKMRAQETTVRKVSAPGDMISIKPDVLKELISLFGIVTNTSLTVTLSIDKPTQTVALPNQREPPAVVVPTSSLLAQQHTHPARGSADRRQTAAFAASNSNSDVAVGAAAPLKPPAPPTPTQNDQQGSGATGLSKYGGVVPVCIRKYGLQPQDAIEAATLLGALVKTTEPASRNKVNTGCAIPEQQQLELELLLAVVMRLCGHDLPQGNETTAQNGSKSSNGVEDNEELLGELEVLSSIFSGSIKYHGQELFGKPCCVLSCDVDLEDELIRELELQMQKLQMHEHEQQSSGAKQAPRHGKTRTKGGHGGSGSGNNNGATKFRSLTELNQGLKATSDQEIESTGEAGKLNNKQLHVIVIIYDVPSYPVGGGLIYGWIQDNSTYPASPMVSVAAARSLSMQSTAHIQAHQIQFEAPAVFEFIQHVREQLPAAVRQFYSQQPQAQPQQQGAYAPLESQPQQPQRSQPGQSQPGQSQPGQSQQKGPKRVHDLSAQYSAEDRARQQQIQAAHLRREVEAAEAVENIVVENKETGPPPMPPMPRTKHMESPEYRAALNRALSDGLSGIAARIRARGDLEYVLPKSTLDALKVEEVYHEETLNRAHSIESLSTRVLIESARLLTEQLQVNKGKAKALINQAKEALAGRRDYFARTEDLMRNKLVRCAKMLAAEREEKKQQKREQRRHGRVRPRGLTLRDALLLQQKQLQHQRRQDLDHEEREDGEVEEDDGEGEEDEEYYDGEGDEEDYEEEAEEEEVEEEKVITPEELEIKRREEAALRARQEADSRKLKAAYERKLQHDVQYRDMLARREVLPAYQRREELVRAVETHSVVVISGDTGCGKTTQVPQLVLDDYIARGKGGECNIIVTQPRRISAISVSERIAKERVEQLGQTAGYHIRLEAKKGPQTRLLLMTTGVLLRRLQVEAEGGLSGVSHIFVDEVHERDVNTDFLLIILKRLLLQRPSLKIVLMSATVNANIFLDYFRSLDCSGLVMGGSRGRSRRKRAAELAKVAAGLRCCMVSIPGRTFPVNTYYLEDALQVTGFEFPPDSPCLLKGGGGKGGKGGHDSGRGGAGLGDGARETAGVDEAWQRQRRAAIDGLRRSSKYTDKVLRGLEAVDEAVVNTQLILQLVLHIMGVGIGGGSGSKQSRRGANAAGAPAKDALPTGIETEGAILVFVPGLANIQDVVECIQSCPLLVNYTGRGTAGGAEGHSAAAVSKQVRVLPLHSSLSSHEQAQVFQSVPPGVRKIVVSTNIAETSVTIEDVVFVIDTCRVKENSYDEMSQMNVLAEMWISRANARQRRGRAGRVREGVCYHLVARSTMEGVFDEYATPEMLKMSLEDIILQILALDFGDPYDFLRGALSPPGDLAVTNALLFLDSLNAVVFNNFDTAYQANQQPGSGGGAGDGVSSGAKRSALAASLDFDLDSEITPLGYHLAALPLNPRIGKLLLYGVVLECLDSVLTIAAAVSVKSVFYSPFNDKEMADEAKLNFLMGNSDLLTYLNAFNTWQELYGKGSGRGAKGGKGGSGKGGGESGKLLQGQGPGPEKKMGEYEFCRVNFLSLHSLRTIEQMREQFLRLLKDIGFVDPTISLGNVARSVYNTHGRHIGLIKCAICAALSPNILAVPAESNSTAGAAGAAGTHKGVERGGSTAVGGGSFAAPSSVTLTSTVRRLGKKLSEVSLQQQNSTSKAPVGAMKVHPSSAMSSAEVLDCGYIVYLEAIRTSQVYIRDVTTVPPLVLALFCSHTKMFQQQHHLQGGVTGVGGLKGGGGVVVVDGWLRFGTASVEASECLLRVRDAMDDAFMQRVLDPASKTSARWRQVLRCISAAIPIT